MYVCHRGVSKNNGLCNIDVTIFYLAGSVIAATEAATTKCAREHAIQDLEITAHPPRTSVGVANTSPITNAAPGT